MKGLFLSFSNSSTSDIMAIHFLKPFSSFGFIFIQSLFTFIIIIQSVFIFLLLYFFLASSSSSCLMLLLPKSLNSGFQPSFLPLHHAIDLLISSSSSQTFGHAQVHVANPHLHLDASQAPQSPWVELELIRQKERVQH